MYSPESMPKDTTFKLRLDTTDRERLELVAAHYSLTVAAVIRMLVKREVDSISSAAPKGAKSKRAKR